MNVVGIVVAAGASTRLGRPKQLVEIDGEPLVQRTIRVIAAARVSKVAVVLGAHLDEIDASLTAPATRLINANWKEGMASSIRVGVGWAMNQGATAVVLGVCDQPLLTTVHIDALIALHESADASANAVVGSRYRGVIGVPAVVPASVFADLLALRGDRGARTLLQNAQAIDWEPGAIDIDTDDDLALARS